MAHSDPQTIPGLASGRRCPSPVPLEPFVHQVGGHFPMVCLDTDTVCKPLKDREHKFYKSMPSVLKPFVPSYEGTMKVETTEDEDGYITLRGLPPAGYFVEKKSKDTGSLSLQQHYRLKRRDSLEIVESQMVLLSPPLSAGIVEGEGDQLGLISSSLPEVPEGSFNCSMESECEPAFYNPWALKCHRDHLRKLGLLRSTTSSGGDASSTNNGIELENAKRLKANNPQTYLLLENLVSRYKQPCILDLKVGTRQYADEVSVAKKQRKIAKAANTTLASLGVRLCGMQVYNSKTGKYVCHNKYFGRSLTPLTFRDAIREFLINDSILRQDVLKLLLNKLGELLKVLKTLDSYRFYTSSLLITYDGLVAAEDDDDVINSDLVDARIIDFAHSTHKGLRDSTQHVGPDEGFIMGLKNFIAILKDIYEGNIELSSHLMAQKTFKEQ